MENLTAQKSTNKSLKITKIMVYLPVNSNVIDWVERTSTGAKQTNQVLIASRARMVQTTQTNVNDKSKCE